MPMPPGTNDNGLDRQAAACHDAGHLLQLLRQWRKVGVGVDVEIHRKFALRIADTEQTVDETVPIGAIV